MRNVTQARSIPLDATAELADCLHAVTDISTASTRSQIAPATMDTMKNATEQATRRTVTVTTMTMVLAIARHQHAEILTSTRKRSFQMTLAGEAIMRNATLATTRQTATGMTIQMARETARCRSVAMDM